MNSPADIGMLFIILICYGASSWMQTKFCKRHLGCTEIKGRLFFVIYFTGSVAAWAISEIIYIPFIVYALLCHIAFTVLVLLLFHAETEKKILGAVILTGIKVIAGNFADSFLSVFVMLFLNLWKKGGAVHIGLWESRMIGSMSFAAVAVLICFLSDRLDGIFRDKENRWYILPALPLIFVILVIDVVNFGASNGVMVVSDANGPDYWNLYYNQLFSHIAICILTALSMWAAGFYVFGMDKIYKEQQKKEQYRSQIAFYKMLEEQYDQMESLRHDMKNHIIGLQGLLEHREWEKMKNYLNRMLEAGNMENGEEVTGNKAVDALLYRKRKQAERKNILWKCDMYIPPICRLDEFDLCVILGNILDNAVEACERLEDGRQRMITLHGGIVKKCFLLEVKNSTAMKKLDETGHSQKDKPGEHGIGMGNIRETVRKYNGAVHMELENHMFIISVLLPC